jgi:hypothetical protein
MVCWWRFIRILGRFQLGVAFMRRETIPGDLRLIRPLGVGTVQLVLTSFDTFQVFVVLETIWVLLL